MPTEWCGLPSGWRNVVSAPQRKRYRVAGTAPATDTEHEVRYRLTRSGLRADDHPGVRLVRADPDRVVLDDAGLRRTFDVARYPDLVVVDSPLGTVSLTPVPLLAEPGTEHAPGSLLAPMPGTVARVAVARGERVRSGQPVLWLEAMKMEHRVDAPADGVLTELPVVAGQQVGQGAVLAVVDTVPDGDGGEGTGDGAPGPGADGTGERTS